MADFYENQEQEEKVLLIGVSTQDEDMEASLDELGELADTAGAVVLGRVIQNREAAHPGTYIGKGKIEEVRLLAEELGADGVICDDELSPAQLRGLEKELELKVMDRTLVILDIFAKHATTREGKLQVEMAQLGYRLARLSGLGKSLSRLGGGIGTRGPGEKKLETDRRLIKSRLARLNRELKQMQLHRDTARKQRLERAVPVAAVVGYTNAGKSTLMNHLIGQKIAITSNKPQTTRNRIQTVLTTEEGQIVFVDTPGIHKAKNKLGEYMVNIAERSLNEVDVVLWLVEPTTFIGAGERHIIDQLKKVRTPVILVINKIDMVKKEEILPAIDVYRKEYDFAEIVPVSARTGNNTDELVKVILKYLPYGPQFYDEDTVTDQPERQIVAELIREKALHCLNEEIPHGIAVAIDRMKMERKVMHIDATIICERDSHKGIIIGKQGSMLKKIGSTARYEIERMLDCRVNLKLWVKVQKNWRDSDYLMKNFGYREDE